MKTNTQSKRAAAIAIFNANLSVLSEKGAKVFRKEVLAKIEAGTQSSTASAAAMYNHAKHLAVEAGKVAAFGREAKVEAPAPVDTNGWKVVDADRNTVATYPSRAKARAAKGPGQSVVGRIVFK